MPLSLFWLCCWADIFPGQDGVGEFDGGRRGVAAAMVGGFLDAVGVVPGALDDAGIGAFAAFVQVPGAGDLGDGAFERALPVRGEKPGRRPGGG